MEEFKRSLSAKLEEAFESALCELYDREDIKTGDVMPDHIWKLFCICENTSEELAKIAAELLELNRA